MGVCGNVCCAAANSLEVLKYVVCLCKEGDRWYVFSLYYVAWSCRCSSMGSMSVSSFRCCMFVSCGSSQCCVLHDLQFVNAGRGCNSTEML